MGTKKAVAKKAVAKKAVAKEAVAKKAVAVRSDSAEFRSAAVNLQSAFAQMFLFFAELCADDSSGVVYAHGGPDKEVLYDDDHNRHTRSWTFGERDGGGVTLHWEMEDRDISFAVSLTNGKVITSALLEASKFQEVQQGVADSYNAVLGRTLGHWFTLRGTEMKPGYVKKLESARGNLTKFLSALLEANMVPHLQEGKILFDDIECSSYYGRATWTPFLLRRFLGQPVLQEELSRMAETIKEQKDERVAIKVPFFQK